MKRLLCAVLLLATTVTWAQTKIAGFVFDDTNGNGKKDRKEKGLAGVAVSNGIDVVATDGNGAYSLTVGNDNIIFVSKPSGYQVAMNDRKLPAFYYIHKPAGSPTSFKYSGVPATGKLPRQVDFALHAVTEPDNYTALIFGDPQPYDTTELNYFEKAVISEVENIKGISLGISLGDIVGDNLDLHLPYLEAMKRIGVPWYNVMGNHDINYEALVDSLADESFEAHFGPANYSFNYGQVHYVILDDVLYPDPRDGKGYQGGFTKSQLKYLENDLKQVDKNKLVILSFHIPLQQYEDSYRTEDRQKVFDLLKDFSNALILSAHTHLQRNDFYTKDDGWQGAKPLHEYNAGTTSGDWYSGEFNQQGVPASTMRDGTPKGYAFIEFAGNQYSIRYKVAGKPDNYQMEIFAPKAIPSYRNTSAGIYTNFFMGTPTDEVTYRIDNGEWKKMTYVKDADPAFVATLFRWDLADNLLAPRRPSNAVDCTHLWRGTFPSGLSVGAHTIEIKAVDRYGKAHSGEKKFDVQGLTSSGK
ncbi:calcineurin-like phosphoesterase family protein [Chryseolinea sp. T2]|uniref:calcineurin-like phosphoesterase family protein n=1 Tax=Chryseolinea sp. T2 TaxID=3129255 RepID=UPI003076D2AA